MSPRELEQYLHQHIPLSKTMQVRVVTVEEGTVVLAAPLEPNINHRETVFGGSASALGILSAWSLLHTRLLTTGVTSRLVIRRNTMEYIRPIMGEFTARSVMDEGEEWRHFTRMLARKGRAKIRVSSILEYVGQVVGEFTGEFVALDAKFQRDEIRARSDSARLGLV